MRSDRAYNILFYSLLENILHFADSPEKFANSLSEQIKSIVGVGIVGVLAQDELTELTTLIGLCPERKKSILDIPELHQMAQFYSYLDKTLYLSRSQTSKGELM